MDRIEQLDIPVALEITAKPANALEQDNERGGSATEGGEELVAHPEEE